MQTSQWEYMGQICVGLISVDYTLTKDFKQEIILNQLLWRCTKTDILQNLNIFQNSVVIASVLIGSSAFLWSLF